ncbi:MAG: 3'-5' exonuclease [Rhodoferax sp.]
MSHDLFSDELFPELHVSASPAPRRGRPRKAAAPTAALAPPPAPAASTPAAVLATPSSTPVADGAAGAEALACQLEQHPDYRVLRRLQPRLQWPCGTPGGQALQVLVLDTETTGLDSAKDRIIELALLRFAWDPASGLPQGEVQVFDQLEDPSFPIPAVAQKITGITDADVAGQRLDEARIAELLQGVDLVIAHNAGFDRPFVERRLGAFAQLPWACSWAEMDWEAEGRGSAKLENLALALGLFYDAHRAETDCHALLRVLSEPCSDQRTGLAHLVERSRQPSFRLQATQAPFEAKDLLKARGYRWNAEARVWVTTLASEAALRDEAAWLRNEVYQRRGAQVRLEALDARVRHSQRAGVESLLALDGAFA